MNVVMGRHPGHACGCGGMADAQDSKSCGGDLVWVQVPPSASYGAKWNCNGSGLRFAPFCNVFFTGGHAPVYSM